MPNSLREVRTKSNCKLWELAARSGVSASTISAIERYNYQPSRKTQEKIATALEVSIQSIWTDDEK
jgi:DNA-binding XRE family transcriptional regulator